MSGSASIIGRNCAKNAQVINIHVVSRAEEAKGAGVVRKAFRLFGLLAITCIVMAGRANADFTRTDDIVFIDGLELSDQFTPGSEYFAHAIVRSSGQNMPVIYVIYYSHKGDRRVLGAFRCDKEFEVVDSMTSGLRDIRCVRENVFEQRTTVLLKFNGGMYEEHRE